MWGHWQRLLWRLNVSDLFYLCQSKCHPIVFFYTGAYVCFLGSPTSNSLAQRPFGSSTFLTIALGTMASTCWNWGCWPIAPWLNWVFLALELRVKVCFKWERKRGILYYRVWLWIVSLPLSGAIALAEVLAESRYLIHVDLRENDIRVAGLMALRLAHRMNHSLLHLETPKTYKVEQVREMLWFTSVGPWAATLSFVLVLACSYIWDFTSLFRSKCFSVHHSYWSAVSISKHTPSLVLFDVVWNACYPRSLF